MKKKVIKASDKDLEMGISLIRKYMSDSGKSILDYNHITHGKLQGDFTSWFSLRVYDDKSLSQGNLWFPILYVVIPCVLLLLLVHFFINPLSALDYNDSSNFILIGFMAALYISCIGWDLSKRIIKGQSRLSVYKGDAVKYKS